MRIIVGADHRGFSMKKEIVEVLRDQGHEVTDVGAASLDPNDDYPTFAERVAEKVKGNSSSMGILLCGSGVGVDIVANKFDNVRAGTAVSVEQIKKAREDDNINVLVVAADFMNEDDVLKIVDGFLNTPYKKSEKHERRLDEIEKIESNN